MDFESARARLILKLRRDIQDEKVLFAMSVVPREEFVPSEQRHFAYEDRPLPIGMEQTISQPLIVAIMTQALELKGTEKVLEIGTGSGYQAAILSGLAESVISVERLPQLAESAQKRLKELGYTNIRVFIAGETLGWPDEAPYDAVIATAGSPSIPLELIDQLKNGGRLVIPVGTRHLQELYKVTRQEKTNKIHNMGGCRFVSLIGRGAWENQAENNLE